MSNKTEKKLRLLFDYQRFEKEPALGRIIEQVEGGVKELSDDELSFVNAAGVTTTGSDKQIRVGTNYGLGDE